MSTHDISLFWKLFNWTPIDIMERNYTFKPKAVMINENGSNYCAIRQVFGVNFITSKMVSCQMHYKNNINRVPFRIVQSYRDLFKIICYGMSSIATFAEYNE